MVDARRESLDPRAAEYTGNRSIWINGADEFFRRSSLDGWGGRRLEVDRGHRVRRRRVSIGRRGFE